VLIAIAVLYFVSAWAAHWLGSGRRSLPSVSSAAWPSRRLGRVTHVYRRDCPRALPRRLVAITQFNVVAGILLAFFSNYLIARLNLGVNEWRWMFGVVAIPSAAFFGLLFLTPNSPRWLVARGRVDEAGGVFRRLGVDDVASEIGEIQASLDMSHHSLREATVPQGVCPAILLAVAIAAFNQLSGINALMYYAPAIFKMAGATRARPCCRPWPWGAPICSSPWRPC